MILGHGLAGYTSTASGRDLVYSSYVPAVPVPDIPDLFTVIKDQGTMLGAVVGGTHGTTPDWHTLTYQMQEALAAEIAHLQATAPVELREGMLAYLLRAAALDTFENLLDQTYPDWRGEH